LLDFNSPHPIISKNPDFGRSHLTMHQTIGLTDKQTRVRGPIEPVSPMHY